MKAANLLRLVCAAALLVGCTSISSEQSAPAPYSLVKDASAKVPAISDVETSLTNTYWKLIELNGQPVVMMSSQRKEAYLQLRKENKVVRGFAGCNNFSGTYETTNSQISLTALMTTRKACVDIMSTEVQFLSLLEQATSFKITGESLILLNSSGDVTAEFAAVYF